MKTPPRLSFSILSSVALACPLISSANQTDEGVEFFEKRIRPVLAQECYECHSTATKSKGGLLLDTRAGWQKGGDSGDAIVPGKPEESLFLKTIRHEEPDLKMPKAGAKLDPQIIADFTRWIQMGAPDPRDKPPTKEQLAADTDWKAVAKRRSEWWSFRPITDPAVPNADPQFSTHPVDQFLREAQIRAGLSPTPDADPFTVNRRLHYVLTGLPEEKVGLEAPASLTDKLLNSPQFGERWARHWMDWFRYSEGHGGQGDTAVPNAFEYRDYLVRALNNNVPYDALIREHLAGDLLPKPRLDSTGMINESRIGIAQFRFVEHGYLPVDSLDELVKFTDNQIDVVTKATLGLTVSCARCHDHKFDAISHKDYHALFGIFASSRPAQRPLITKETIASHREELKQARTALASALKSQWLNEATSETIQARLQKWTQDRAKAVAEHQADLKDTSKKDAKKIAPEPIAATGLIRPWNDWNEKSDLSKEWALFADKLTKLRSEAATHNEQITERRWDLRKGLPPDWYVADGHLTAHPSGELGIGVTNDDTAISVLPAGLFTCESSAFEQAAIASNDLTIPDGAMAIQWAGAGHAFARLSPENYPMSGLIYTQNQAADDGSSDWFSRGTDFWKGCRGYFHITTQLTAPVAVHSEYKKKTAKKDETQTRGSWFSIAEVRLLKSPKDTIKPETFSVAPLFSGEHSAPQNTTQLAALYATTIQEVLQRWQTPAFTDEDALFLTDCLQTGLLVGSTTELDNTAKSALHHLRGIEDQFAQAARRSAPGVIESPGFNQPFYARGNHLKPGEPVERAFISSLGGKPYGLQTGTGRLQLAQELTRPENPLFARVIANRLWHHVFGHGLVTTTDNFGRTGQQPTHPELLDHLASRLIRTGFDLKDNIRYLVSSRSFRLSSQAAPATTTSDPTNRLLSHAPVRRMDAEIIRDHLLSVSGNLDPTMQGPSTSLKAGSAMDRRRGLYVQTKREGQNELFASFDVPMPNTTRGTRDVSTTPGQAITLLNSPFIQYQAEKWAEHATAAMQKGSTAEEQLTSLITQAFSRPGRPEELTALRGYFEEHLSEGSSAALKQSAHLVFNLKEFIYIP
ncbi:MAG: PSD1 and planctomycete cytochrome C domain-containing protein [Verrucomicrobiota bacterium]